MFDRDWSCVIETHIDTGLAAIISLKFALLEMMKKCQHADPSVSRIILARFLYLVGLIEIENAIQKHSVCLPHPFLVDFYSQLSFEVCYFYQLLVTLGLFFKYK